MEIEETVLKEEICLEIEGRGRVLGGLHAANQTRLLEQRVVAAQNSEEKKGAIEPRPARIIEEKE